MILLFLQLLVRLYYASTCTESETSFYAYFQTISFDLTILFSNHWNSTSHDGCDEYFGSKNDTMFTLESMNNIFCEILRSDQQLTIQKIPHTQLSNNLTFINCSSANNTVTSNTYFETATMDNKTFILHNDFYVSSTELLKRHFTDAVITLSFHHQSIIIVHKPIHIIMQNYKLLYLLLFPLLMCICIVIYLKKKYMNAYIIHKVLVLVIGVSEFDDKKKSLPGVPRSVADLVSLWKEQYNYDVYACNPDTFYCTKNDIIDFIDRHISKLIEVPRQCVIIHILSHSSKDNIFVTSDEKTIPLDFFVHELSSADYYQHESLTKIIFNHACRGDAEYSYSAEVATRGLLTFKKKLKDTKQKQNKNDISDDEKSKENYESNLIIDACNSVEDVRFSQSLGDVNFAIISGTVKGRALSDTGIFTECICDAFKQNVSRIWKHDFTQLLTELSRDVEQKTNGAEIVSRYSTICYPNIRFVKCSEKESKINEESTEMHYVNLSEPLIT